MDLSCPSCDSTFRIDPDQIGPSGRQVRCGGCGHEWTQPQISEDEAPVSEDEAPAQAAAEVPDEIAEQGPDEIPAEPETQAPPADAEPPSDQMPADPPCAARRRGAKPGAAPPSRSSGRRIAAGWLVFFIVIGALAAGAYFGKARIVAAVPAAAELYRLAGMPVEPPVGLGLELRDVKSVRRLIDGQRVVVIQGTIANVSDSPRDVPRLRASVTDPTGVEVDQWDFSANISNLAPGGETQFETSTRNAPREGRLGIDFVAAK